MCLAPLKAFRGFKVWDVAGLESLKVATRARHFDIVVGAMAISTIHKYSQGSTNAIARDSLKDKYDYL